MLVLRKITKKTGFSNWSDIGVRRRSKEVLGFIKFLGVRFLAWSQLYYSPRLGTKTSGK